MKLHAMILLTGLILGIFTMKEAISANTIDMVTTKAVMFFLYASPPTPPRRPAYMPAEDNLATLVFHGYAYEFLKYATVPVDIMSKILERLGFQNIIIIQLQLPPQLTRRKGS